MPRLQTTLSLALALLILGLATAAAAASYAIDTAHSSVGFKIRHLGVSWVRGSFTDVAGTIAYDNANPTDAEVSVTIQTGSVNTGQSKRDDHLRTADFFDVATYPTITFESTGVENLTADSFDLIGDLTIHGITKEVVLHVSEVTPEMDFNGTIKRGAVATTTIDRTDFGVGAPNSGPIEMLGSKVEITLELELNVVTPEADAS